MRRTFTSAPVPVALLLAVAIVIAALVLMLVMRDTATPAHAERVLLGAAGEPETAAAVEEFAAAGFVTVTGDDAAMQALGTQTGVVVVTRDGLDLLAAHASALDERDVVVGGIDVALPELRAAAGAAPRDAFGPPGAGDEPLYSMFLSGTCEESQFSDRMSHWDVVGRTLDYVDRAAQCRAAGGRG